MSKQSATPMAGATELPKTDVVIVGVGAAGGIAAYVLAEAGLKVVGLEAGPRLTAEDFLAKYDELEGYQFYNHTGDAKTNHEVPTWRKTPDGEMIEGAFAIRMANMVGGSSVHYTTQSWRLNADDFRVLSSTIERYGEEAIPEGAALADWPVTYDDLEPYYELVENMIGVSGAAGSNAFESPRNSDYPMPPLQRAGIVNLAYEALETLGYHPFQAPSAIASEEYNGRPACSYCGYCTGYGCWNDSKSSTLVTSIPTAEATGNFEVRPNSRVFRVLVNDEGKASGVEYRGEDGEMYIQPAGLVILSAYSFENVRLMLLSTSEQFPNGLANNHGQVGKYFMTHSYPGITGYFPGQNFNHLSGGLVQNASFDDFNSDNFDHTDLGFLRGGVLQIGVQESTPISASRKVPPGKPTWGSEYKRWIHEDALSITGTGSILEVLPYEDNFLDLDPEVVDRDGVPVVRITFDLKENEHKMWEFMQPKLEEIFREMGATEVWAPPLEPLSRSSHDLGGTRAGNDPATSVLDRHLLAHEVPNLAVFSGSVFPTGAGYNPTQTIQAYTWLACDYIAANFAELSS